MANNSYPYASSIVKAREPGLLTSDKLMRIAEAGNAQDALDAVMEAGYGRGTRDLESAYDFETLIAKELNTTRALIAEITPDRRATDLFFVKYDYHNVKVMLKVLVKKEPLKNGLFLDAGTIPLNRLKEEIEGKSYDSFSEPLRDALQKIENQLNLNGDPSHIGYLLDKAHAIDVVNALNGLDQPLLKRYFEGFFDFSNVIALLRLRQAGYDQSMLKRVFLPGGRLPESMLIKNFETDDKNIAQCFTRGAYERYMKKAFDALSATGRLFMFEKQRDDYLLDTVRQRRHDMFGIAPAVGYLLAKEREASGIRMLMTAKLNRIGNDVLFERLKELFV